MAHLSFVSGEADLQAKSRPVTAQTRCPFCDGSVLLELEPSDRTRDDALARLRGTQATCPRPACGRAFAVRRREITVRLK